MQSAVDSNFQLQLTIVSKGCMYSMFSSRVIVVVSDSLYGHHGETNMEFYCLILSFDIPLSPFDNRDWTT